MCCKPKYRANIIHHFIFVSFRYFFYHSSCCKDQITVLSLKFGFQDFTDPGLPKDPAEHDWFVVVVLPAQVFQCHQNCGIVVPVAHLSSKVGEI